MHGYAGIAGLLLLTLGSAPDEANAGARVLEIRSYQLKPGTRAQFHRAVVSQALPLLRRWRFDVVAFGPSLHDHNSYFLIRAFSSVAERERVEDAFYSSADWVEGPRAAILEHIESYVTVVIEVRDEAVNSLRQITPARGEMRQPFATGATNHEQTG